MSSSKILRHLVAASAWAIVAAGAHAQKAADATKTDAAPTLQLQVPAVEFGRDEMFSSSVADDSAANNEVAVAANHFDFVSALANQPPPRYGGRRPRYRGGNTNPDGSNKYGFLVGAGLAQPIGNTYHYLTPSYGFQVGAGRNFSKTLGMMVQFDYDHFGMTKRVIQGESLIFTGTTADTGLDGTSHIWSITLDPTVNLYSGEGLGAYVVGGVGFYHKVANFTYPQQGTYCDPFYGCFQFTANSQFQGGNYTSNAPGFNGGFGLTYKVSRFSNERLYVEARYVYIANSQRQGVTVNNVNTAPTTATNFYPANSNRTTYIPIKFGIRF